MSNRPYGLFGHLSSISLLQPISFSPFHDPGFMFILSLLLPKKLFPVLFDFLHPNPIFLSVWFLKSQLLQENLNKCLTSLEYCVVVANENVGVILVVQDIPKAFDQLVKLFFRVQAEKFGFDCCILLFYYFELLFSGVFANVADEFAQDLEAGDYIVLLFILVGS